jgi:hypothetical protein
MGQSINEVMNNTLSPVHSLLAGFSNRRWLKISRQDAKAPRKTGILGAFAALRDYKSSNPSIQNWISNL